MGYEWEELVISRAVIPAVTFLWYLREKGNDEDGDVTTARGTSKGSEMDCLKI